MKNATILDQIKAVIKNHDAGQINTGLALAKIHSLSKRYGNGHAATVNTQDNEVRMGCSRKIQPRDVTARH